MPQNRGSLYGEETFKKHSMDTLAVTKKQSAWTPFSGGGVNTTLLPEERQLYGFSQRKFQDGGQTESSPRCAATNSLDLVEFECFTQVLNTISQKDPVMILLVSYRYKGSKNIQTMERGQDGREGFSQHLKTMCWSSSHCTKLGVI